MNKYFAVVILCVIAIGLYLYIPKNKENRPIQPSKSSQNLPTGTDAVMVSHNLPSDYITIPFVRLSSPGFVMVHKSENGKPGEIVMTGKLLTKGEHNDVIVQTENRTNAGEKYFAMLHVDDGNGVYDNPTIDPPILLNNLVVQEEFEIKESITASFKVITHKITRTFDNAMYKNQSQEVYIPNDDSKSVVVTTNGVTWGDFFETLPFSISYECLVTGDGERLCSGEDGELSFELNKELVENALSRRINEGDEFIIRFQ